MGLRGLCGIAATAVLVASCATHEWRHPNVPENVWPRDEADCARRAAAKVEDEAARDERYAGGGGGARVRDDRTTARETMMTRFEIKKRHARLAENCMKAKGYGKVEAE